MMYMAWLLCIGIVVGLFGLCCSVMPYFGVICVIVSSVFCCGLVAANGCSFISLLLFIVYLGGMMVVFAYSVVMTEGFEFSFVGEGGFVKENVVLCGVVSVGAGFSLWVGLYEFDFVSSGLGLWSFLSVDGVGVALLYSVGMISLMLCAWGLLLALFVVVEMVRGGTHGGGLRSV
uniref:NADH-ubiquinone oxidoreductase chain 6 n=1 Tax=Amerotyphlops reticulatus TaxID=534403 RepID=B3GT27_9SAUR|nr:NADH dehydrogenase subunit 6 [Amerotyphlops reticulatus]ACD85897.1 NADH dehydrogenase subunit 6 [Amerotyphlops reticulatus]